MEKMNAKAAVVGIGVSKDNCAIAVADDELGGDVCDWGMIPATNEAADRLRRKLRRKQTANMRQRCPAQPRDFLNVRRLCADHCLL